MRPLSRKVMLILIDPTHIVVNNYFNKLLFDSFFKMVQEYTVFGNPYMNVKLTYDVVTSY